MPYDYSQAAKPPEPSWDDELSTPRGSHEDVVAAYKEELRKVKEALHLAMSASGAEALESRYLAQIKKNKNLTVQLASERTRCLQMERQWKEEEKKVKEYQAEQEKQRRKAQRKAGGGGSNGPPLEMMDIVKDVATRRAKERMGYDTTTAAADAKMQPKVHRGGAEDEEEDEEEEMQETIRKLRERLERSFKMIAERDAQVNESRREAQLWRQVVQRETGATREEVDRIFRDAVQAGGGGKTSSVESPKAVKASAKAPPVGEEEGDSDDNAVVSTAGKAATAAQELRLHAKDGWRGRAQTIILLKGKLKDAEAALRQSKQREESLQAALATAAKSTAVGSVLGGGASSAAPPRWVDDGTGGGDDLESLMALAQLSAKPVTSERPSLQPPPPPTRSASNTAGKDVDDEARDHLAQLGNRRLQQQRELEATVDQLRERLAEEQRRHKALQGRFTTVQRDAQQLRQHVEVILQKSQADDELIAAYKEELVATQEELRDAREWNAELQQDYAGNGNDRLPYPYGEEDEPSSGENRNGSSSNPAARDRRREFIRAERRRKAKREEEQQQQREQQDREERQRKREAGEVSDEAGIEVDHGGSERASREKFFAHLRQHLTTIQSQQLPLQTGDDGAGGRAAAVVERLRLDFESLTEYIFAYMKALEAPAVTREQKWDQLYRLYQALQHSVQEALAKTTGAGSGGGPRQSPAVKELESVLRQAAALPPLEESVLRENAQLKERLRTLTALLDKVEAARQVWAAAGQEKLAEASQAPKKGTHIAGGQPENADASTDLVSVEMLQQYQKLQKDYAELKKEFNRMQMKRMNNDPKGI